VDFFGAGGKAAARNIGGAKGFLPQTMKEITMSDAKKNLDQADTGGGIGDIPAQPRGDSARSVQRNDPVTDGEGDTGRIAGAALKVDEDAAPGGEDPDDTADETLGETP
jgi:hypothetical protein